MRKPKISIKAIGKTRFWTGVISGIISAIIISFTFNYTRETFRFFTGMSGDLFILNDKEFHFYNLFYATLSTTLGVSITVWIWMSNHYHRRRNERIYKQLSRTNALLAFWVVLSIIARFGTVLFIVVYSMPGYDNQLSLYNEFWLLFILTPIVIFFQNWTAVRLAYQTNRWILASVIICFFTTIIINFLTVVDQEKVNNAYYQRFEKDYKFIAEQVSYAKSEYNIDFKAETIDILKKWETESSINQTAHLKKAFQKPTPVSLDTIILQKIAIRNFKKDKWYYNRRNSIENWPYALPVDVLRQIKLAKSNQSKVKELFNILNEQIQLVNTPPYNWNKYKNLTETEIRKSLAAKHLFSDSLRQQLRMVSDSLLLANKYQELANELPEVK